VLTEVSCQSAVLLGLSPLSADSEEMAGPVLFLSAQRLPGREKPGLRV